MAKVELSSRRTIGEWEEACGGCWRRGAFRTVTDVLVWDCWQEDGDERKRIGWLKPLRSQRRTDRWSVSSAPLAAERHDVRQLS